MKPKISLITIWTNDIIPMTAFYEQTLGFTVKLDLGEYVEFESEGVRFALCLRKVMTGFSDEYAKEASGQQFELAFPCDNPQDVDDSYKRLIEKGAVPIQDPQNMPWNQRTALFADPDGNVHEIFADLNV